MGTDKDVNVKMTYMLVRQGEDENILERSDNLGYLKYVKVYLVKKDIHSLYIFKIFTCGKEQVG